MTINAHVTTLNGLPVFAFDPEGELPADSAAVAWRIEAEEFESPPEEFAARLEALVSRVPEGQIRALIIGEWGSAYDSGPPIDLLVSLAPRLTGLRALFLGEMTFEECEISWIHQGDITPLLTAFPALEVLRVRGAEGLELQPVRHAALRELAFESGGLPGAVVRAVGASDLPVLQRLELWLGTSEYGADATHRGPRPDPRRGPASRPAPPGPLRCRDRGRGGHGHRHRTGGRPARRPRPVDGGPR